MAKLYHRYSSTSYPSVLLTAVSCPNYLRVKTSDTTNYYVQLLREFDTYGHLYARMSGITYKIPSYNDYSSSWLVYTNIQSSSNLYATGFLSSTGYFCAIAQNGNVWYSTNGYNWTSGTSIQPFSYTQMIEGQGSIVCSTTTTGVAVSTNGTSWTVYNGVLPSQGTLITYSGTNFVTIANSTATTSVSYTSNPTTSWGSSTMNSIASGQIVSDRKGKVIIPAFATTSFNYSTDHGVTWNSGTYPVVPVSIQYGEGIWVMTSTSAITSVYTSPNGIDSWTQRSNVFPLFTGVGATISYGNGVFLAHNNSQLICYSSYDGITWTQAGGMSQSIQRGLTYGKNTFVNLYYATYNSVSRSSYLTGI